MILCDRPNRPQCASCPPVGLIHPTPVRNSKKGRLQKNRNHCERFTGQEDQLVCQFSVHMSNDTQRADHYVNVNSFVYIF